IERRDDVQRATWLLSTSLLARTGPVVWYDVRMITGHEPGAGRAGPEHEPIVHDSWHALRETREEAKANKERLVFHCAEDATGTPLTIERLVALAQEQPWFRKGGKGTLLNDTSWYNDEPFYKQETAPTGWRLVSAEPLEASFNQNYAEQTFTLYEQLKARSLVD